MKQISILWIGILLFSFQFSFAQDEQQQSLEIPNFTPPTPSAYELGKFGELPIGMFTGTSNVSVPLMEFKAKSLSIPIALGYNSNGIKVDQLGTKVGLGWNLNAGGVISRTVNHGPDELNGYVRPENIDNNFFTPAWAYYFDNLVYQVPGGGISQPLEIDGEPDIFSFNFLGRTGRFTIDNENNQRKIVLLDGVALKISFDPSQTGEFLIIDEQGNKFFFADIEETRLDNIGGSTEFNSLGRYMTTSWSLSRIETPNGEEIYFDYTDEEYIYVTSQSQNVSIVANPLITATMPCNIPVNPPKESPIINHNLLARGKRLTKISSNNPTQGSINFQYNQSHPEVTNYSLLTQINQLDKRGAEIEWVNFNYAEIRKRIFLEKLQYKDITKTYDFEYVNFDQMPERLSLRKDNWGYYNGKANTTLYPDLSGLGNTLGNRFAAAFGNGANKEIDEEKAKIGLLKKVIYPTKGYTELAYESHSYNELTEVSEQNTVSMEIRTDGATQNAEQVVVIDDVAKNQIVPIHHLIFDINPITECFENPTPLADRKLFIKIENLTNTQYDIINKINSTTGGTEGIGNDLTIAKEQNPGPYSNGYYLNLNKDNDYKITINVFYECLMGQLRFDYVNTVPSFVSLNKKTGGLRVAKTINFDQGNKFLSSNKYHYTSKENLDKSSGSRGFDPYFISRFTLAGECILGDVNPICFSWKEDYYRLNSGSLRSLYRSSVQNTRYEYVTISHAKEDLLNENQEDFANGGVEYKFKLSRSSQAYSINGTLANIVSEGVRDWGDGLELQKIYFQKEGSNFKKVKEEINHYQRDNRVNDSITGFKVSRQFFLPCRKFDTNDSGEQAVIVFRDEFNVTRYYLKSNWSYMDSKTIRDYDSNGENPVESINRYFYDNPEHGQITKMELLNSDGDFTKRETRYPQDLSIISEAEENLIIQNRIALPIETLTYIQKETGSDQLLNRIYNQYRDWGNSYLAIEKVISEKENQGKEDRIIYHNYDSLGNPLEVSKELGVHTIFVWGYNDMYPIAKIENASYELMTAAQLDIINIAKNATQSDVDGFSENDLRNSLDQIRELFPNAMVSTYTYDPLIGITSMTNPKGYTTFYEYDDFNRLTLVRDAEGNIVSKNEYNYKTNN